MSELSAPFEMALPSFMQHLRLLEGCGLVRSTKQGRVRTYELSPEPLNVAESWLSGQRAHWQQRLNRLDSYLSVLHQASKPSKPNQKKNKEPK